MSVPLASWRRKNPFTRSRRLVYKAGQFGGETFHVKEG